MWQNGTRGVRLTNAVSATADANKFSAFSVGRDVCYFEWGSVWSEITRKSTPPNGLISMESYVGILGCECDARSVCFTLPEGADIRAFPVPLLIRSPAHQISHNRDVNAPQLQMTRSVSLATSTPRVHCSVPPVIIGLCARLVDAVNIFLLRISWARFYRIALDWPSAAQSTNIRRSSRISLEFFYEFHQRPDSLCAHNELKVWYLHIISIS